MKTEPYTYSGLSLFEAAERINEVANNFLANKFVVFKKAAPSDLERSQFMVEMAKQVKWKVDFDVEGQIQFTYEENHSLSTSAAEKANRNDKTDIIVSWHIEHPHQKFPPAGGLWYMHDKDDNKEAGSTGFVDNSILCQMLNNDDVEFLNRCHIVQMAFFFENENENVDMLKSLQKDGDAEFITLLHPNRQDVIPSYVRKPIVSHHTTGQQLLRISPKGHYLSDGYEGHDRLLRFDGRRPTKSETTKFNQIAEWCHRTVYDDKDIQYFHFWDKGDVVLVDTLSLVHCVRGGFYTGQRYMKGCWGFPLVPGLLRDPEQLGEFPLHQLRNS